MLYMTKSISSLWTLINQCCKVPLQIIFLDDDILLWCLHSLWSGNCQSPGLMIWSDDEIGRGAGNFFRALAPHNLLDPEFVPEIKFVIYKKNGNYARYAKHFQKVVKIFVENVYADCRCKLIYRFLQYVNILNETKRTILSNKIKYRCCYICFCKLLIKAQWRKRRARVLILINLKLH